MPVVNHVRDIAAHYASGAAPRLMFRRLLAAGRSAQTPPPFLLGPANEPVLDEIFAELDTPEVGCYEIRDAAVAPTGIAIAGDMAFSSWAFLHPHHHVVTVTARVNAEKLPVREVSGAVAVIYGPAHETWGHWLTDFLPRLWVLRECGHDLATLRFLAPPDLLPFARDLLALCGVRDEQVERYAYWREYLRCETLLMPTGLRRGNRLSPAFAKATAFWRGLLPLPPVAQAGARLFISRDGAPQQRQMSNRAEIEAAARRRGYAVLCPEHLSLLEQMAVFGGAREIVGEYGSALHNSVFADAGTVVCGLRGNSRHPSFVQSGIATALGQQAAYVFGATGGQDVDQRFRIDAASFERALDIMALLC